MIYFLWKAINLDSVTHSTMKKNRRKALGQHFLKDKKALRKIVRLIDPRPEETLIEIGPGKGVLTFLLTQKAGRVIAVEKDSRPPLYLKRKRQKTSKF